MDGWKPGTINKNHWLSLMETKSLYACLMRLVLVSIIQFRNCLKTFSFPTFACGELPTRALGREMWPKTMKLVAKRLYAVAWMNTTPRTMIVGLSKFFCLTRLRRKLAKFRLDFAFRTGELHQGVLGAYMYSYIGLLAPIVGLLAYMQAR